MAGSVHNDQTNANNAKYRVDDLQVFQARHESMFHIADECAGSCGLSWSGWTAQKLDKEGKKTASEGRHGQVAW